MRTQTNLYEKQDFGNKLPLLEDKCRAYY